MKKSIKFLVTIALIAILGFVFTACEEVSISISGSAIVGRTLTASHDGGSYADDGGYRWQVSAEGSPSGWFNVTGHSSYGIITGRVNQEFEIEPGSLGRFIRATRKTVDGDTIVSNVKGPVMPLVP